VKVGSSFFWNQRLFRQTLILSISTMSSGNLGCKEEERGSSLICVNYLVEFLGAKEEA
jgi:hypothetical protein